ncbi:phage tail tape measure protein, partial [Vibrio vulnificus]|uniref:phage tail tape measure protein n=1 Tax=Vibrio vulnificus TaxID=672 RepID=UPI0024DFD212
GMSLEETAAMAGLLGNVGIKSSQAGTTLRAMVSRLAAPTGAAAKTLERLGVSTKDASGDMRNMVEIIGDIEKKKKKKEKKKKRKKRENPSECTLNSYSVDSDLSSCTASTFCSLRKY